MCIIWKENHMDVWEPITKMNVGDIKSDTKYRGLTEICGI